MSEVHGAFSIRDLPSTSGGQPNVIAKSCNVLGVFLTIRQQPKRELLTPSVGVFVRWSMALREHCQPTFKLCMYIYSPSYVYLGISDRYSKCVLMTFETYILSPYPPPSSFCICILNLIPIKIPISFFIETQKDPKILMESPKIPHS